MCYIETGAGEDLLFSRRKIEDYSIGMAFDTIAGILDTGKADPERLSEIYDFTMPKRKAISNSILSIAKRLELMRRSWQKISGHFGDEYYLQYLSKELIYEALAQRYKRYKIRHTSPISDWMIENVEWLYNFIDFFNVKSLDDLRIGRWYLRKLFLSKITWKDRIEFEVQYCQVELANELIEYDSDELNSGINACLDIVGESRFNEYAIDYTYVNIPDKELLYRFNVLTKVEKGIEEVFSQCGFQSNRKDNTYRLSTGKLGHILGSSVPSNSFAFRHVYSRILHRARFFNDVEAYDLSMKYLDSFKDWEKWFYEYALQHGVYPTGEMIEDWIDKHPEFSKV